MGTRLPFISKLYEMTKANVLIVSYRGYGFSEGSPSEKGIQKDAVVFIILFSSTQKIYQGNY